MSCLQRSKILGPLRTVNGTSVEKLQKHWLKRAMQKNVTIDSAPLAMLAARPRPCSDSPLGETTALGKQQPLTSSGLTLGPQEINLLSFSQVL